MKLLPGVIYILFLSVFGLAKAQTGSVKGTITNDSGQPLVNVSIYLAANQQGIISDLEGNYELRLPAGKHTISFSHLGFQTRAIPIELKPGEDILLDVVLTELARELEDVEIRSDPETQADEIGQVHKVSAKAARSLPSAFGDFNKILVTLPGVSSNNELSSAYSVRGGNFDENLVYVNDIPVYRPFLSNAGRQEGLSFVNPDLVQDIEFYAGGWEPKYGDKLSSSLNIEYKEPDSIEAGITLGLLGGTAYAGGKSDRVSYLFGVRHRDSRYLLNSLEVSGQYFPTYTDFQSLLTFDLSRKSSNVLNKTKLSWLLSYGRNRYLTMPVSQSTDFGSVSQNYRLETAFEGREILRYDTYQTGFRLTHRFSDLLRSHLIGSGLMTQEKEQYDVEGAYRLCDVNNNPNSNSFNDCVVIRGIGTNYEYGRNSLDASLYSLENRNEYLLNVNHVLEAGAGVYWQKIHDELNEYTFIDSAGYISVENTVFNDIDLFTNQFFGYVQNTLLWKDSMHALSSGVRLTYWDYNGQWLISPRFSYRYAPKWDQKTTFKLSAGVYQQPPFYREIRAFDGTIKKDVRAQKSIHFIGNMTRLFYMWGRSFLFSTDLYRKQLYDVIPYDIDNVRLRYYAKNSGNAFAHGVDFRVHGEFISGTQSWFSLSLLQTKENLSDDSYTVYLDDDGKEVFPNSPGFVNVEDTTQRSIGYVRRPSDQRINLAVYFEDHMPYDPSLRVYLNLVFGSGYPFGPPKSARYRNAFSGDEYYRADVGFSKSFDVSVNNFFNKLWVRVEVLNALGADNTLSYTWKEDVNGNQFAIPNSLSARFLNIKLSAEL